MQAMKIILQVFKYGVGIIIFHLIYTKTNLLLASTFLTIFLVLGPSLIYQLIKENQQASKLRPKEKKERELVY